MAAAAAAAAPAGALGGGRVEELGEELLRCVQEAQAQFARERDTAFLEFEAGRVQLHTEYSQRLFETDKELQALQEERALLHEPGEVSEARQNDVVTLNVGGRPYSVKRETLCICEGSFLAELFSGRWERSLQRDASGSVFLDVDPVVFELLLAWLRDKKIETPERPAPPPNVAKEDLQHFQAVVDYLGLRPYLELPGFGPDGWAPANKPQAVRPLGAGLPAAGADGKEQGGASPREPRGSLLEAAGSFLASWRGGGSSSSSSAPVAAGAGVGFETGAVGSQAGAAGAAGVGAGGRAPGGKTIGWSQRFAHPAARRGEGDAIATVAIGDTRPQATAAAVRATRGYQSGVHYWEVRVLVLSDVSYIGFVSAEWTAVHVPVGQAPGSWALASSGAILACGEEVARLPHGFGEGSTVGLLLELGSEGHRTATVFVDGRRHRDLFLDLPETVYPAVSNNRAPAQYSLSCDASPPEEPAPPAPAAASAGRSAVEAGGEAYLD